MTINHDFMAFPDLPSPPGKPESPGSEQPDNGPLGSPGKPEAPGSEQPDSALPEAADSCLITSVRLRLVYASELLDDGHYPEAQAIASQLAAQNPQSAAAWNVLALSLELALDYDRAIAAYQHTRQVDPGNVFACRHLGLCYQALGQTDLAQQYFERAMFPGEP